MFGDKLKELRKEKGLTQQQLADLMNVGRSSIAGYETKRVQPDYEKLLWFSSYFDVSVEYLLGSSKTRNNDSNSYKEPTPEIPMTKESSSYELTRDPAEENKILQYYYRLNDENKDYIKGQMINLYREQISKSNLLKNSPETG
jgi:transcriptional regulator with XRE-family HTH domain